MRTFTRHHHHHHRHHHHAHGSTAQFDDEREQHQRKFPSSSIVVVARPSLVVRSISSKLHHHRPPQLLAVVNSAGNSTGDRGGGGNRRPLLASSRDRSHDHDDDDDDDDNHALLPIATHGMTTASTTTNTTTTTTNNGKKLSSPPPRRPAAVSTAVRLHAAPVRRAWNRVNTTLHGLNGRHNALLRGGNSTHHYSHPQHRQKQKQRQHDFKESRDDDDDDEEAHLLRGNHYHDDDYYHNDNDNCSGNMHPSLYHSREEVEERTADTLPVQSAVVDSVVDFGGFDDVNDRDNDRDNDQLLQQQQQQQPQQQPQPNQQPNKRSGSSSSTTTSNHVASCVETEDTTSIASGDTTTTTTTTTTTSEGNSNAVPMNVTLSPDGSASATSTNTTNNTAAAAAAAASNAANNTATTHIANENALQQTIEVTRMSSDLSSLVGLQISQQMTLTDGSVEEEGDGDEDEDEEEKEEQEEKEVEEEKEEKEEKEEQEEENQVVLVASTSPYTEIETKWHHPHYHPSIVEYSSEEDESHANENNKGEEATAPVMPSHSRSPSMESESTLGTEGTIDFDSDSWNYNHHRHHQHHHCHIHQTNATATVRTTTTTTAAPNTTATTTVSLETTPSNNYFKSENTTKKKLHNYHPTILRATAGSFITISPNSTTRSLYYHGIVGGDESENSYSFIEQQQPQQQVMMTEKKNVETDHPDFELQSPKLATDTAPATNIAVSDKINKKIHNYLHSITGSLGSPSNVGRKLQYKGIVAGNSESFEQVMVEDNSVQKDEKLDLKSSIAAAAAIAPTIQSFKPSALSTAAATTTTTTTTQTPSNNAAKLNSYLHSITSSLTPKTTNRSSLQQYQGIVYGGLSESFEQEVADSAEKEDEFEWNKPIVEATSNATNFQSPQSVVQLSDVRVKLEPTFCSVVSGVNGCQLHFGHHEDQQQQQVMKPTIIDQEEASFASALHDYDSTTHFVDDVKTIKPEEEAPVDEQRTVNQTQVIRPDNTTTQKEEECFERQDTEFFASDDWGNDEDDSASKSSDPFGSFTVNVEALRDIFQKTTPAIDEMQEDAYLLRGLEKRHASSTSASADASAAAATYSPNIKDAGSNDYTVDVHVVEEGDYEVNTISLSPRSGAFVFDRLEPAEDESSEDSDYESGSDAFGAYVDSLDESDYEEYECGANAMNAKGAESNTAGGVDDCNEQRRKLDHIDTTESISPVSSSDQHTQVSNETFDHLRSFWSREWTDLTLEDISEVSKYDESDSLKAVANDEVNPLANHEADALTEDEHSAGDQLSMKDDSLNEESLEYDVEDEDYDEECDDYLHGYRLGSYLENILEEENESEAETELAIYAENDFPRICAVNPISEKSNNIDPTEGSNANDIDPVECIDIDSPQVCTAEQMMIRKSDDSAPSESNANDTEPAECKEIDSSDDCTPDQTSEKSDDSAPSESANNNDSEPTQSEVIKLTTPHESNDVDNLDAVENKEIVSSESTHVAQSNKHFGDIAPSDNGASHYLESAGWGEIVSFESTSIDHETKKINLSPPLADDTTFEDRDKSMQSQLVLNHEKHENAGKPSSVVFRSSRPMKKLHNKIKKRAIANAKAKKPLKFGLIDLEKGSNRNKSSKEFNEKDAIVLNEIPQRDFGDDVAIAKALDVLEKRKIVAPKEEHYDEELNIVLKENHSSKDAQKTSFSPSADDASIDCLGQLKYYLSPVQSECDSTSIPSSRSLSHDAGKHLDQETGTDNEKEVESWRVCEEKGDNASASAHAENIEEKEGAEYGLIKSDNMNMEREKEDVEENSSEKIFKVGFEGKQGVGEGFSEKTEDLDLEGVGNMGDASRNKTVVLNGNVTQKLFHENSELLETLAVTQAELTKLQKQLEHVTNQRNELIATSVIIQSVPKIASHSEYDAETRDLIEWMEGSPDDGSI